MAETPVSKQTHTTTEWERIERLPEFRELIAAKMRFIVPACVFFSSYYFALPILVGWFPELMKTKVFGPVNVAYLFALSQFFMAWIVAILYVRAANGFDKTVAKILEKSE